MLSSSAMAAKDCQFLPNAKQLIVGVATMVCVSRKAADTRHYGTSSSFAPAFHSSQLFRNCALGHHAIRTRHRTVEVIDQNQRKLSGPPRVSYMRPTAHLSL